MKIFKFTWSKLNMGSGTGLASFRQQWVHIMRLEQNGQHLAHSILKCIFLKETNHKDFTEDIPEGPMDNMSALINVILVIAWRRIAGAKPWPEPMMAQFTDTYVSSGLAELKVLDWLRYVGEYTTKNIPKFLHWEGSFGTLSFNSSHGHSFEDQVLVDFSHCAE